MKKTTFFLVLFFIGLGNIFAMTSFVNSKGVLIESDVYEYIKDYYSETRINTLTQEKYDEIKERNYRLVERSEKYFITNTYVSKNKLTVPFSITQEVTKEEYDSYVPTRWSCTDENYEDCWETNSKKLTLNIACKPNNSYNCGFFLHTEWKTNPSTRSFDVLALRWSGLVFSNLEAHQFATVNDNLQDIEYDETSNNAKHTLTGAGVSMNLLNNGYGFQLDLDVNGIRTSSMNVFGTYQHATSSVTLSQSKDYTFSNSGLGNVLYYSDSSISNKYDGMQGVSFAGFIP